MNQSFSKSILIKIGFAILLISLIDLFYLNWWILKKGRSEAANGKISDSRVVSVESPSPSPDLSPIPAPSPSPTSAPIILNKTDAKTVVQTAQKEIFIPIGSGSTKSGTFADISGLAVTIDTTKYSAIDSVVFEATVWVDGGNGRAWAKLKNVSDNNPFIESQITSSSGTGEVKTSGNIPIPSGAKTYGVQAKTDLTDYYTHVDNARLKIVLR